jgi:hypothetical protein
MATRSRIALETESGIVKSIYCHWDGYVSGVGKTLYNHYDREKLEKLIELGDISSLGESTENTVAYCRDRGEDFHSTDYLNIEGFFGNCFRSGEEYAYYLNKDGVWMLYTLQNLVKVLKDELEE